MSIRIFYDRTDFRLKGSRKACKFIEEVIRKEGNISGDLSFIFTDDESLKKINVQFLNHDYFTDVISFEYNTDDKINGEVYISIDTVLKNSVNYNVSLKNEVLRVMIHGVLHLLGYDDKTSKERKKMQSLEEMFLSDYYFLKDEL